jgi:hypothetical protein
MPQVPHDVERAGREHVYRVKALRKTRPEWGRVIMTVSTTPRRLDHLVPARDPPHRHAPARRRRDTHFRSTERRESSGTNFGSWGSTDQVAPLERLQPYYGRYGADYDSPMILKRLSNSAGAGHSARPGTAWWRPATTPTALSKPSFLRVALNPRRAARFTLTPDPDMDVEPSFVRRAQRHAARRWRRRLGDAERNCRASS